MDAGVLSSYGEMEWMASGEAGYKLFDPCASQAGISFKAGFQKQYIALESFEEGAAKLKEYAKSMVKVDLNEDGSPSCVLNK